MLLAPGAYLGPYQIVSALGEGGMGEVYRGRDKRLNRDVAIKILRGDVASDPERLARFGREAQVLASLNHPNIAHIHGFEESSSTPALIMELVEGATLADRLARGAMPVDEALHVARQIADALDAAHERGIIHRDLKPANIKVTPAGLVKVLDFGLAKAIDASGAEHSSAHGADNSPTMTGPAVMSRTGVILGTAAYMSPEQAKGAMVDKRADIWAFGCVLFEMLTGQRVFSGDSVPETLAAVMRDDVRLDRLPATTPPPVARVIARCLERDPKRRLRDVGEARVTIDDAIASAAVISEPLRTTPRSARGSPLWRFGPWIVAATAIAVAAYTVVRPNSSITRESFELEIAPPPDAHFVIESNSGNVQLSPDGTRILFRAALGTRDALWIRSLARDDARPLAGTENASYPFWAPDSRRLAFFAGGKLKTLDTAAGLPQVIADAPNGRGGSWGDNDVILFAPVGGGVILRVAASGGDTAVVTRLDTGRGENAHYWPFVLPGSRRFLYFARSVRPENNGIYVAAMDGSSATRLVSSLSSGIYAPPFDGLPGHLMWAQNDELLAQPFDVDRGALTGEPSPIASGVRVIESQRTLLASVSQTGTLAWASPRAALARFTWFGRDGRRLESLPVKEGDLRQPELSPDGGRLLYTRSSNGTADIFLFDFASGTDRRVTLSPDYDEEPVWSPDGTEMVHVGNDAGQRTMMRVRLDGSVPPVELMRETAQYTPVAWSPDRRYILYRTNAPGSGLDILAFPADEPKKAVPLLTGPGNEGPYAAFSPDGRWIAFVSDRSGRFETYIVRFRGDLSPPAISGQPVQITTNGGAILASGWRRDGREILVASGDGVMAIPIDARGESVSAGKPVPLFRPAASASEVIATANADRFLVIEYPYADGQTIHVLTNWRARLAQIE